MGSNNSSYYVLLLILSESQKFGWYSAYLSGTGTTDASIVGTILLFQIFTAHTKSCNNELGTLCTLPSTFRRQVYGSGKLTYEISATDGAAEYSVLALQCKSPVPQSQYTFCKKGFSLFVFHLFFHYWLIFCYTALAITTEMVNARPSGDGVSQLSIDTVMMTRVLEGTIILYFFMLFGLLGQILISRYAIDFWDDVNNDLSFHSYCWSFLFIFLSLIIVNNCGVPISGQNVMKIHYLFVGTIAIAIANNFAKYCGKRVW